MRNSVTDGRQKGSWGGMRVGAGRKKSGKRHDAPHRRRPELSNATPVHVVLRVSKSVPHLRRRSTYAGLRRVLTRYLGRDDFRIVHLSIQGTHIHFLIEAGDEDSLTVGMQSLSISSARALNKALGRKGKVFAFRYHATQIKTTRHARHALGYVLNNWRKHQEDVASERSLRAQIDPYSSGISFSGWNGSASFTLPKGYDPLPVSPPQSYLLAVGWKLHGEIGLFEVPGPYRISDRRLLFEAHR